MKTSRRQCCVLLVCKHVLLSPKTVIMNVQASDLLPHWFLGFYLETRLHSITILLTGKAWWRAVLIKTLIERGLGLPLIATVDLEKTNWFPRVTKAWLEPNLSPQWSVPRWIGPVGPKTSRNLKALLSKALQSTLALWTPRYYGHPDNTDSS